MNKKNSGFYQESWLPIRDNNEFEKLMVLNHDKKDEGTERTKYSCRIIPNWDHGKMLNAHLPTVNSKEVWKECVSRYGENVQVDIAIEEMSELIKALLKYRCKKTENEQRRHSDGSNLKSLLEDISEETADVIIMIEQLLMIYHNEETVDKWIHYKAERQRKRMEEDRAK